MGWRSWQVNCAAAPQWGRGASGPTTNLVPCTPYKVRTDTPRDRPTPAAAGVWWGSALRWVGLLAKITRSRRI
jgi:hypothetical protein